MLATGAGAALASHALKTGTRALLNTSPEPVSNWTASATEDVTTLGALALAFAHPLLALILVVTLSVAFALFVWWLWRALFRRRPRPQAVKRRQTRHGRSGPHAMRGSGMNRGGTDNGPPTRIE